MHAHVMDILKKERIAYHTKWLLNLWDGKYKNMLYVYEKHKVNIYGIRHREPKAIKDTNAVDGMTYSSYQT